MKCIRITLQSLLALVLIVSFAQDTFAAVGAVRSEDTLAISVGGGFRRSNRARGSRTAEGVQGTPRGTYRRDATRVQHKSKRNVQQSRPTRKRGEKVKLQTR
jgi:hypothetical protein